MIFLEILGNVVFWISMLVGFFLIPVGFPGTFLIFVSSLIYGWATDYTEITAKVLVALFFVAVIAEVIEFVIGAATAGKFGGSRQGMTGAIVGGFLGAIWMTPLMPILGTIVGAFAGAFAGATLFEYLKTKDWDKAVQVGFGAFLGTLGGRLTKIAAGAGMIVVVGFRIF